MITIRHRETGESLLEWPEDTLAAAELANAVLLDLTGPAAPTSVVPSSPG